MTKIEQIEAMNENEIGTNVVYWPILHRGGKRTKTRSKAFIDAAGQPVILVESVSAYVSIDHVEIGSLMPLDSPCFSKDFSHKW